MLTFRNAITITSCKNLGPSSYNTEYKPVVVLVSILSRDILNLECGLEGKRAPFGAVPRISVTEASISSQVVCTRSSWP